MGNIGSTSSNSFAVLVARIDGLIHVSGRQATVRNDTKPYANLARYGPLPRWVFADTNRLQPDAAERR